MADFTPPPREKNALDHPKLALKAPTPGFENATGKDKKVASLSWNVFANNPRITVYTNDPSEQGNRDKNYGKITANIDTPNFYRLMHFLYLMSDKATPNGTKMKIDNKNFTFPGGKRSERPEVVSTTWIGKDDEGAVWISVVAPAHQKRPIIKFVFGFDEFHHYAHGDGTPLTIAEFSPAAASAYVEELKGIMPVVIVDKYVAPEPKDNNGGGNRGGGNRSYGNNNSGAGSGKSFGQGDVDDDIPF
jgi:hypothetical protein